MSLEILTSDLLGPVRHGFFTRRGGASSGVFEGLNCGLGSTDQSDAVVLNRAKVADAMGVAPQDLRSVTQVHSADVVEITAEPQPRDATLADGMVTRTPGVALGILTADCQPVLFHDAEAQVIGAAHAGWKGALSGVLEATVEAMEALGAERGRIVAAIGPTISQAAYEVGPEFLETMLADDPAASRFFVNGNDGRYLFDLPGFGLARMRAFGIGRAEWIRHCTYADPTRFYSYRRATHNKEADYGRLISTIVL